MGFREIVKKIDTATQGAGWPAGASRRYKRLDAFDRLLSGTLYDHMTTPFELEFRSSNEYVPVRERRPSVIYPLASIAVEQHAALTFGEAHFPHVRCLKPTSSATGEEEADVEVGDDGEVKAPEPTPEEKKRRLTEEACAALIRALRIPAVMSAAVLRGSIGSAAIIAKIRPDKSAKLEVISGKNALPVLDIENPDKLEAIDRIWPVDGDTLKNFGYTIDEGDLDRTFWLRVKIDAKDWTWYLPLRDDEYAALGTVRKRKGVRRAENPQTGERIEWKKDETRSGPHGFSGTVPAVWLRNLCIGDDAIDGPCTFEKIVDLCVTVDYEESQLDRGLRYSMDPLLIIKAGEMGQAAMELAKGGGRDGGYAKTPGNALPLMGENADAKLLETNGAGYKEARENVKQLREYGLEAIGGLKSDQEHASGTQSGRALQFLMLTVFWYVERYRVSYGDNGLVPLLRILLVALRDGLIDLRDDMDWSGIDPEAPLSLIWPQFWLPRGADLLAEVKAVALAAGSSEHTPSPLIDGEIASQVISQTFDLDDPQSVAKKARMEREKRKAEANQQQQQSHENALELQGAKASKGSD